jgi:curved DNA-binding protein CbpA
MDRDPKGFYRLLGVDPASPAGVIVAAFRRKARLLHPDVPITGDAEAFIELKQAYDALSDPLRRLDYDRMARRRAEPVHMRGPVVVPDQDFSDPLPERKRGPDLSLVIAICIVLVTLAGIVAWNSHRASRQAALQEAAARSRPTIRPNAPTVTFAGPNADDPSVPRSPPAPLPGVTNYYITPSPGRTILWRPGIGTELPQPVRDLAAFTALQALRRHGQTNLIEIRASETGLGLVDATRLIPGDSAAAARAFCAHHAGVLPGNGDVLRQSGTGNGRLLVRNRSLQPAVLKLRTSDGRSAISVFIGPNAEAEIKGLPEADYRPEYAIGEMWSRPCGLFVGGMRAQRLGAARPLAALTPLVIPPDPTASVVLSDILDADFIRD